MNTDSMNPAKRLLDLLLEGQTQGRGASKAAGHVWALVLGVEYESPKYLRLIASINTLIADLIELVQKTDVTEPVRKNYLTTLQYVYRIYQGPQLAASWEATQKILSEQVITTLHHLDNQFRLDSQLRDHYSSRCISEDQIQEFKAEIEQVCEQLDKSDVPPELAKLLRSHVEAIRRILAHYNIYGNEGLQDAIKRILGELQLHHEIFRSHGASPAVKAYKNLLRKLVVVSNVMGHAAAAITVGQAVTHLLGS